MKLSHLFAFVAVAGAPLHAGIVDYTGYLASGDLNIPQAFPTASYVIGFGYFPSTGDLWVASEKALFVANPSTDTSLSLFVGFPDTIVLTSFASAVAGCPLFTACPNPQGDMLISSSGAKLEDVSTSTGAISISQANEDIVAFAESANGLYGVGNGRISLVPAGGSESNGLVAPVEIATVPGTYNEDVGYGLQIGSDGNLYLYDPLSQSIYVYDTSGGLLSTIAVPAGYAPYAFTMDSSGHYFLATPDGTGISAFDLSGNLLASGSAPAQPSTCGECGNVYLATDNAGDVYEFDPNSATVNEFSFSSGAPEPATFGLFILGFAALLAMREAAAQKSQVW